MDIIGYTQLMGVWARNYSMQHYMIRQAAWHLSISVHGDQRQKKKKKQKVAFLECSYRNVSQHCLLQLA